MKPVGFPLPAVRYPPFIAFHSPFAQRPAPYFFAVPFSQYSIGFCPAFVQT